jgi:hypothetical protein
MMMMVINATVIHGSETTDATNGSTRRAGGPTQWQGSSQPGYVQSGRQACMHRNVGACAAPFFVLGLMAQKPQMRPMGRHAGQEAPLSGKGRHSQYMCSRSCTNVGACAVQVRVQCKCVSHAVSWPQTSKEGNAATALKPSDGRKL